MTAFDMQLRALAGVAGSGGKAFTIPNGVRPIDVSFSTDSDDDVTSMQLTIAYDLATGSAIGRPKVVATRPLEIELRREHARDRQAKQSGVSLEWHAGEPAFDDAVYVSTPTSEPDVLAQVLVPQVRQGVLALLELGCDRIRIDADGKLEARVPAGQLKPSAEPERAQRCVAAFEQIAKHVPPLQHSGKKRAPAPLAGWSLALMLLGCAGWLLNVGYVGLVTILLSAATGRSTDPDLPVLPMIGCVVAGIVVGFFGGGAYGRLVGRLAKGRSDAHTVASSATIRAFGGISVLVFTLGYALVFVFLAHD